MIICISLNPAIDRRLHVGQLEIGRVNRAHFARPAPGGKATHVAMTAQRLGADVTWVGLAGGATGDECARGLASLGIPSVIVKTGSATRVNLEIIDREGTITEILEPGGVIKPEELDEMFIVCHQLFARHENNAQVVLAGSLPPSVPSNFYFRLAREAHAYSCRVLLDTSGEALVAGLEASPDFVKPNRDEAEWMLGRPVRDEQAALDASRLMTQSGAQSVAVSLGADGLLWSNAAEQKIIVARPPTVAVRSTVGCGDATVAGFAVAASRSLDMEETVRLAVACGAANCLADSPGMINAEKVRELASMVSVRLAS